MKPRLSGGRTKLTRAERLIEQRKQQQEELEKYNQASSARVITKILSLVFIISCIFIIYGYYIEFVPSDRVNKVAKVLAIILTISLFGFGFKVFGFKSFITNTRSRRKPLQLAELVFRIYFAGYLLYILFAYAIPGLYTRIFGELYAKVEIVQPIKRHRAYECDFFIKNKYLEPTVGGHICISKMSYNSKEQVYILMGKRTKLGFYVEDAIPNSIFKQINQKIMQYK